MGQICGGVKLDTNASWIIRDFPFRYCLKFGVRCHLRYPWIGAHDFLVKHFLTSISPGWWFQIFCIFTPKIGEDSHFDSYFFKWGWTHQLVNHWIVYQHLKPLQPSRAFLASRTPTSGQRINLHTTFQIQRTVNQQQKWSAWMFFYTYRWWKESG